MSNKEKVEYLKNSEERNYLYNLIEEYSDMGADKDNVIDFLIESIILAKANNMDIIDYIKEEERKAKEGE